MKVYEHFVHCPEVFPRARHVRWAILSLQIVSDVTDAGIALVVRAMFDSYAG